MVECYVILVLAFYSPVVLMFVVSIFLLLLLLEQFCSFTRRVFNEGQLPVACTAHTHNTLVWPCRISCCVFAIQLNSFWPTEHHHFTTWKLNYRAGQWRQNCSAVDLHLHSRTQPVSSERVRRHSMLRLCGKESIIWSMPGRFHLPTMTLQQNILFNNNKIQKQSMKSNADGNHNAVWQRIDETKSADKRITRSDG